MFQIFPHKIFSFSRLHNFNKTVNRKMTRRSRKSTKCRVCLADGNTSLHSVGAGELTPAHMLETVVATKVFIIKLDIFELCLHII